MFEYLKYLFTLNLKAEDKINYKNASGSTHLKSLSKMTDYGRKTE